MATKAQVNERSSVPLWRQIANSLDEEIRDGNLKVGDTMPSYRKLSVDWDVGPSTAMNALAELRRRGLITEERGQPSRVSNAPEFRRTSAKYHRKDQTPAAVSDHENRLVAPQGRVSTEAATRLIAERLGIDEGDQVSRVDYFWEDENGPIQRSTQWEPLAITQGTSAEFPPVDGYPHVIARMDAIGQHVDHVQERSRSRLPTAAEAEELKIEDGAVTFIKRTHYVGTTSVETADITIRGDRVEIVTDHIVE